MSLHALRSGIPDVRCLINYYNITSPWNGTDCFVAESEYNSWHRRVNANLKSWTRMLEILEDPTVKWSVNRTTCRKWNISDSFKSPFPVVPYANVRWKHRLSGLESNFLCLWNVKYNFTVACGVRQLRVRVAFVVSLWWFKNNTVIFFLQYHSLPNAKLPYIHPLLDTGSEQPLLCFSTVKSLPFSPFLTRHFCVTSD